MENKCWYCLKSAFLGSVKIVTSESSLNECMATTTGRRPTNSGIMPKFTRSCVSRAWRRSSLSFISSLLVVSCFMISVRSRRSVGSFGLCWEPNPSTFVLVTGEKRWKFYNINIKMSTNPSTFVLVTGEKRWKFYNINIKMSMFLGSSYAFYFIFNIHYDIL